MLRLTRRRCLILTLTCWLAVAAGATPIPGRVSFSPDPSGSAPGQAPLRTVILSLWNRYLHGDAKGYCALLTTDSLRLSPRSNGIQRGPGQISAGLSKEWQSLERSGKVIAGRMTLRRPEFWIDDSAQTATALYWVEHEGGHHWPEREQGLVFQVLSKRGGHWKVAYQTDSWGLSYNLQHSRPGPSSPFSFDMVYPVLDLPRAVAFYTPLLGVPESITAGRAAFNINGARFVLEAANSRPGNKVKPGLPGGYVMFATDDLAAQRRRLQQVGVSFLKEKDPTLFRIDNDPIAVAADPMGNIFVLLEKRMGSTVFRRGGIVRGFTGSDAYEQAAQAWANAWLRTDAGGLVALCGPGGRYFDDSCKARGLESDAALRASLSHNYWRGYDQASTGLAARLDVTAVHTLSCGGRTVVAYQKTLTGTGPHPFRTSAYVTQVFSTPDRAILTLIVNKPRREAQAIRMDAAYPATYLKLARHFYGDVLKLGPGVTHGNRFDYRGVHGDFGVYEAKPKRDGIPRLREGNGCANFWVRSADATYSYLKSQHSTFPVIQAIQTRQGVESKPGCRQIFTTDSEGNGVLFTEYQGRRL